VVKEFRDSMGNVQEPLATRTRGKVPVDDGYLQMVRAGMRQSVTNGVARPAGIPGVSVAGKTGTAEFGSVQYDGKHPTHGWFMGFAPYEDPRIAVVVFVQRGSGGKDAAPAAARIFDFYFNGARPDQPTPAPGEPTPAPTPVAPGPGPVPGDNTVTGPVAPAEVPTATPPPAQPTPGPATPAPATPPPATLPPEPTLTPAAGPRKKKGRSRSP
jgi:penicillin-binding protein 2